MRYPSEAFRSPCEGVLTFAKGSRNIGEFNEGRPNGQGKLIFTNGAQYEGEVQDGVPSGRGAYLYGKGMHYAGQFLNGLQNGQGTLTLPDGSQCTGEFKDGKLVQKRVEGERLRFRIKLNHLVSSCSTGFGAKRLRIKRRCDAQLMF